MTATQNKAQSAVYHRAVALLARREHSRQELARKLGSKFPDSEQLIDAACERLVEQGYLSDERFAHAYARARLTRGFGGMRIERELQERGVSSELIQQALEACCDASRHEGQDIPEEQALYRAWQKKFSEPAQTPQEKARQMRFLLYRGFSHDRIRRLFEQLESHSAEI